MCRNEIVIRGPWIILKHTKFEKIFLMVLTNQLIYLVSESVNGQSHEEDFFKLCMLLKKSELYLK